MNEKEMELDRGDDRKTTTSIKINRKEENSDNTYTNTY